MDWRNHSIRMALKFGPAFLVVVSFVTILLGIILHSISIDQLQYISPAARHFDPTVIIDDHPTDLVWFLQVTDLHLSNRGHFERAKDFSDFATKYVDIIKPDVVLVTGDITDGIKPNTTFSTGPQLEEWLAYSEAIERSNKHNRNTTVWLDIRGNHDNFNVYRPQDPKTLYRRYSVQGKLHSRNYMYNLSKNGKNYTFIGVDEVQTPGLKIPFNFIGIVKDQDLTELKEFKGQSQQDESQYRVWFAHYPTSSIASPHEGLRNIIDGPYLCGHFHTIGNWVTKMHATQQPGYAEVELGDWKYNRRVRLAAIDHQLFSLVDIGFNQFPIALMTNPKNAEYSMPKYEPVGRIGNSTHIRVIAFSNATITNVAISIDGKPREKMSYVDGPLYALRWNPADYKTGLHRVNILVEDAEGKSITYHQSFSQDNQYEDFSFGAKVLIRAYFKSNVMAIFFFVVTICTFPMLILRTIRYQHDDSIIKRHYKGTLLYNLHLLSNINRLFWPLFLIPIYLAVGPHFVGYMVDEAIGACFVWGVLIDGTFIHTGITYNVGSIFLLLVHIPITILSTSQVASCHKSLASSNKPATIVNAKLLVYIVATALQLCMGYLLTSAYGLLAFATSFPFLWCLFIYANCLYQCTTLEKKDFSKFTPSGNQEEEQALTNQQKTRDDKSSTSDNSTC